MKIYYGDHILELLDPPDLFSELFEKVPVKEVCRIIQYFLPCEWLNNCTEHRVDEFCYASKAGRHYRFALCKKHSTYYSNLVDKQIRVISVYNYPGCHYCRFTSSYYSMLPTNFCETYVDVVKFCSISCCMMYLYEIRKNKKNFLCNLTTEKLFDFSHFIQDL